VSDPEITPSEPVEGAGEIVNPEDLPSQIEVTDHDGVTRVDIAEGATVRPGEPGPRDDRDRTPADAGANGGLGSQGTIPAEPGSAGIGAGEPTTFEPEEDPEAAEARDPNAPQ